MDLSFTDDLCADEIEAAQEARVAGGVVRVGEVARVLAGVEGEEARGLEGRQVTVQGIAVGSKGKGPFRKRLWVALWVTDEEGAGARVMAKDLEVATAP